MKTPAVRVDFKVKVKTLVRGELTLSFPVPESSVKRKLDKIFE